MPAGPTAFRSAPEAVLRNRLGFAALALVALATALIAVPTASAAPATYRGSSANGEVVFFETTEQLLPGDTDTKRDVYERYYDSEPGVESYVTREVSIGPAGGNGAYNATFEKVNEEGTKVFFTTEEALVEGDTDHRADIYMRNLETGRTTLVSQGEAACAPGCGNGPFDTVLWGISADGSKAYFTTAERLAGTDTDSSVDIYARDLETGETTLVSQGGEGCVECGNGAFAAGFAGASADGTEVFFATAEKLTAGDADNAVDIYARDLETETTTLVSRADSSCSNCGGEEEVPVFHGSSEDGGRVFFSTDEKLVEADGDGTTDIYARDLPGGPTTLVSGGSEAGKTASFEANSADGRHVFFTTAEPLAPEDEDNANDIYEWSEGAGIDLVTSAPCTGNCGGGATFDAASADSETVLFNTAEQLSGEDTQDGVDIYEQEVGGGAPVLVSRPAAGCTGCGSGTAGARFDRASGDAQHVVFTSSEVLSDEDKDEEDDIYARDLASGETSLITTSPSWCSLKRGNCGATFAGVSADGRHVFFTSIERFTLEDGDDEADVYERFLGPLPGEEVTRLVSTGNDPNLELGPPAPTLEGTDPGSPDASTTPKVLGQAEAGATVKIYETSDCSGEPVAHGSAEQLEEPGIAVSVAAGSTTSFRATAEAEGFVSACSGSLSYIQQAGSGGGGGSGGSGGSGGTTSGGGAGGVGGSGSGGTAYVTPHTRITFAPAAKTRARHPVFRFADATGQPGTKFRCRLDRHRWKPCGSPLRLKHVTRGRHVLEIRAVNAAGTWEPRPAQRKFKRVLR